MRCCVRNKSWEVDGSPLVQGLSWSQLLRKVVPVGAVFGLEVCGCVGGGGLMDRWICGSVCNGMHVLEGCKAMCRRYAVTICCGREALRLVNQ